jgi:hypothetical protein
VSDDQIGDDDSPLLNRSLERKKKRSNATTSSIPIDEPMVASAPPGFEKKANMIVEPDVRGKFPLSCCLAFHLARPGTTTF